MRLRLPGDCLSCSGKYCSLPRVPPEDDDEEDRDGEDDECVDCNKVTDTGMSNRQHSCSTGKDEGVPPGMKNGDAVLMLP